MTFPRIDTTKDDIVGAFTVVMHVLGEKGRATLRAHLLKSSDSDDARNCLRVMNDVERIMDYREQWGTS